MVVERSRKIAQGLVDAKHASEELSRVDAVYAQQMSKAESAALEVLRQAEQDAQVQVQKIVAKGEERKESIVQEARQLAESVRVEEMQNLENDAKVFVQSVVAKTVALDPSLIDTKLIEQAVHLIRAERIAHKTA